ncbi:hypothetical protein [Nissabacter sp. SGAir0207]|uniref:hypothetical protein n=1 Tax=Nissabacter sp. SGAir0207 TaxID=2126321 RepID=UPI0010CD209E|nr:hypothetical protein [Nissabacter sp. SGAir0207]QCR38881.1 hypothetical protein C1N62_22465 [Nissabacter sp. SGAir0207]
MKITNEIIENDIKEIIISLSKEKVEVPAFLECIKFGGGVMVGMTVWQFFVAYPHMSGGKMDRLFACASIGFTLVLGLIVFLSSFSLSAKYLSIPKKIRDQSVIIKMLKNKVLIFSLAWALVNVIVGVSSISLHLDPMFGSSVIQLITLLLFYFLFLLDISRYDISILSALIKRWRGGESLKS